MREQSTTNNIFQPKHVRGGETKVMKAMKKSILTFLAFALVFTMAMPAFAANVATGAQYSDIENADVADAVKVLSSLEVLQGYPDGTFKPDNSITRAEFSAVVVRLLGYEKAAQAAVGKTPFKDEVLPWASGYVNIAVQQNLLTGYPDGTFRANQPVTQAEALTILVRALGYKALADKQGQWPYNYIVMADSIGLTEDLDGVVANQPANRGFVALASEAALTVPKAIASGFTINGEINYVVSGTQNTKEQTILANDLKYASKKAIVTEIPRINSKLAKDEIKIVYKDADDKNVTKTVTVPAGFDFEAAFGAETTLYLDGSKVVYAKADGLLYDAIDAAKKADNKVKLLDADKSYEFAKDVVVYIDGKEKSVAELQTIDYQYGKVALDKSDDIRFLEVYSLPQYLVVEETKDNVVYSYGETLNVEKYTVVKDGKTVKVEDLQKGDIFFYSTTAKFAEVYNKTITNKISHVFTDGIRVDGEDYAYNNALYLDGDKLYTLTKDEAKAMQEEGEVTIFLNRLGKLVFISGDLGKVATSSMYSVLEENVVKDTELGRTIAAVEVVKPDGKSQLFKADMKAEFYDKAGVKHDADFFAGATLTAGAKEGFAKGNVVKLTVNDEGKLTKVAYAAFVPNVDGDTDDFKVTSTYANGKKLQGSAVVYLEGDDEYTVFNWADAEEHFSVVKAGKVYYDANDRVVAMVVTKSDAADSYKAYNAFVSTVKELTNGKQQIKVVIDNTTYEFVVDETPVVTEKTVIELNVNDKMDAAKVSDTPLSHEVGVVKKEANLRDNTLPVTVNGSDKTFEFTNTAYIYDLTNKKTVELRTLKAGDGVKLYAVKDTTRFINVALVTPSEAPKDNVASGVVTYIDATGKAVDKVTVAAGTPLALSVNFNNTTDKNISVAATKVTGQLVDKNGASVATTGTLMPSTAFVALAGKTVNLGTITNNIATAGTYTIIVTVEESATVKHEAELTVTVTASVADANAAKAVVDEITALGATPTKAAVTTANTNYTALSANAKELVTNYATLKAFVDDIAAGGTVEGLMTTLTTNKQIKDARVAYDKLGALGKAEVTSYANLTTAETNLANAKTAITSAIATAQPLYDAQNSRINSFTAAEINAINASVTDANGFTTYQTALAALKTDLDAAKAIDLNADATTITAITTAESALTTEIGTFNTAKGVFDAIPEVVATGK